MAEKHEPQPVLERTSFGTPGPFDPGVTTGLEEHFKQVGPRAAVTERYVLGEEIARGGMGVVYRATDTTFGREVAVKVLQKAFDPSSATFRRFGAEARIAAQLQHPGIPPVHDQGTLPDGRPFLAMKLIKGRTLDDLLKDRPDPSIERGRFVAVFEKVCQALAYAHSHFVIHRDLKPANVMVGNFGEVQVMDWGLAKVLGTKAAEEADHDATTAVTALQAELESNDSETQAGSILGTPAYMPPEQALGAINEVDARSDVFGLGGLLAVVLTGKPPFTANTAETTRIQAAQGKLEDCFTRLNASGADPDLIALCKTCLNPSPHQRPANAGEVAEAIAALRQAADERARRAELDRVQAEGEKRTAELQIAEQRKRRHLQVALVAAIGLIFAIGGVVAYWQQEQASTRRSEGLQRQLEDERRDADERNRLVQNGDALAAHVQKCEDALQAGNADGAQETLVEIDRRLPDGGGSAVVERVARCRADLAVLRNIDVIDRFRLVPINNRFPDTKVVSARWRTAFIAAGLDPSTLSADEIARRIQFSLLRDRLIASLDIWHAEVGEPQLRDILHIADPDPFRNAIRDAFVARDKEGVAKLAEQPDALTQPPGFAVVLGRNVAVPVTRGRAVLEASLRSHPGHLGLLTALGNSYPPMQKEFVNERLRWFQAAVAAHPRFMPAHINLGNSLNTKGDVAGAIAAFREAIQLDPTYAPVHCNLGMTLASVRKYDDAITEFHESIRLDPTFVLPRNELGITKAMKGDFPGAISELRAAISIEPTNSSAHVNLGIALLQTKDPEGAIAEFGEALKHDPNSAFAHFNLAIALASKGDLDGAITHFEQVLHLQPDNANAKQRLDRARKQKAEQNEKKELWDGNG